MRRRTRWPNSSLRNSPDITVAPHAVAHSVSDAASDIRVIRRLEPPFVFRGLYLYWRIDFFAGIAHAIAQTP